MNNYTSETKIKILQTAIDLVGKRGEVTIREITIEAGVNVASINYYFGNKNNLLKEVENHYSALLYDIQHSILMDDSLSPKQKLVSWVKNLIEFISKFPALIKLIVNLTTEDSQYNPILIQKIYLNKEIQEKIQDIIRQITGVEDKKILGYKYLQIFSGILGPVVGLLVINTFGRGEVGEFMTGVNTPEDLEEYIGFVVDSIVAYK